MALATSGEISIAGSTSGRSIALEFGRGATSQLSLSELYRNGGIVSSNNTPVPTSGQVSLDQFYGASGRISSSVTLSANVNNYNLTTANVPSYAAGNTDVTVTINSGVTVGASSEGGTAFTIAAFSPGDKIIINNYGTVEGGGGKGGGGPSSPTGNNGGPAFDLSPTNASVTINNQSGGIIAGGGGGGGAGRAVYVTYPSGYGYATMYSRGGGGGGGAGAGTPGTGGAAIGTYYGYPPVYYAAATTGSTGSATAGGNGATGDYGHWAFVSPNYYVRAGVGGNGGGRGAAGANGANAFYGGDDLGTQPIPTPSGPFWYVSGGSVYALGPGGSAGNAIKGTGKLATFPISNAGTIYGPQVA